jgi:UDP-3-O-[3-hydroxymyristoyl] glucosamine N-acyltransferase
MPEILLSKIAATLGLPAPAADPTITGMAYLTDAGPGDLSFLGSDAYLADFHKTKASAVLVQKKVKLPPGSPVPTLIVDDADLAVGRVLELFAPPVPQPPKGVDPTARVAPTATIDPSCSVGPNVVVGDRTRVGPNTVLHANVYVGADVVVGADCQFFPNVVVRERITVGNRVTIHASSVLGTDGFGYRWDGKQHAKIPQIGTVVIEDDVEIGSCACVDRAKFGATRVGRGSKIDNLVQIAHNANIGPFCIFAGQAGIAGSVTLGAGVVLGGQCAVRDHVTMGDRSMLAACSGAASDVEPGMVVSGLPAIPHRQQLREQAALRRLPDLVQQVRKMQDEIEQLKKAAGK